MRLKEDWEFNVLGIYNYKKPGQLRHYFDYIIEHHDCIEGDICEAGVFRGRSLLATGLLLKELGSEKQVYGFDSFQGFPPIYHKNDDILKFEGLLKDGVITEDHYSRIRKNMKLRALYIKGNMSASNISLSGDFTDVTIEDVRRKIDLLELKNIHLMPGSFGETMNSEQRLPEKIMCALLDCDLYLSYKAALPFIWERLSVGGYVFTDEYYSLKFPGARIATDEFFADKEDKPRRHKQEPGDFERWYVQKFHENNR